MLVFRKSAKLRLQNAIRREPSAWTSPFSAFFQQGNLGLRSSQADLSDRASGSAWYALFANRLQVVCNFLVGQPLNRCCVDRCPFELLYVLRWSKLYGSRAVCADVSQ